MANKRSQKSMYPDDYGRQLPGVLPDVLSPISVDNEGDKLVPPNDLGALAKPFVKGTEIPDPLDLVYQIEKDGTKGTGAGSKRR